MSVIGKFNDGMEKYTSELDGGRSLFIECNGARYNIKTHNAMTGNCQLFCVAYAANLLVFDNKRELFLQIYNKVGKPLMLIDINQFYKKHVYKLFQSHEILIDNNYKSTNGSDMCIMVLNLRTMLNRQG